MNEISSKYIFTQYSIMILTNFLHIRLQKSNYQGQKFIILNFSKYKVLKMKLWHGKRQKIKDSMDEISSKYIFTQYSIMILLCVEICQYHNTILCKNIFRGYFIHRIFDFLPFSVRKLHFQRLIFAKIQYNEFLSLIIGFLQPYYQKFVDIIILYCVKIYLEDI